ncbi:MAG: signal recognition particle protein [Actinomycetales bacterium]|nr:signal recognition particle protein [Actinomycetales bacterium]
MFESLSEKFQSAFATLRGRGRIGEGEISVVCDEIRNALIDSDVARTVADKFVERIQLEASANLDSIKLSTNPSQEIYSIVQRELVRILGGAGRRLKFAKNPPTIIMLAGLQGSGKTTLAGKLSNFLKESGNTPLLVAADLQRPNAVNQLSVIANGIDIPIFAPQPGNGVGDPVEVAREGVALAKAKFHNVVIIDTAGRLGVDEEMMEQIRSIRDVVKPDEILFVVDAMIGQDAIRTAQAFNQGVNFDAIVITKMDGDAKGGAALSITEETKKPILFISNGEKTSDFDYFYPERMASRILGLGDIQTLAEQAKRVVDTDTAKRLEDKFLSGQSFTLEDFLEQIQAMQKMGSMSKVLGLLPGANSASMKKQLAAIDDNELVRTKAIVQSMTPQERREPKILNGSRRVRIANGSGRTVTEVNNLVDRFDAAAKMMKQMKNGGGGLPMAPQIARPVPPKKKSRSGNPAKRAQEESR